VDIEHPDTETSGLDTGFCDRIRNIVKLKVEENFDAGI